MLKKITNNLISLSLVISLNWFGIFAVLGAGAFFNDYEAGRPTVFSASILDFSLESDNDFLPEVKPGISAERQIEVINQGNMDFNYDISISFPGTASDLCSVLDLEVRRNGALLSTGPLMDFNLNNLHLDAGSADSFNFVAGLSVIDYEYRNQECEFDFDFIGRQIDAAGFYDEESISNIIHSGTWSNLADHLVINKVYYNVDSARGADGKNEWIELFNPTGEEISLKRWQICDKDYCFRINQNVSLASSSYALVAHDASTWKYWDIPEGVEKIHQLGGQFFNLDNTADMLQLISPEGAVIDQLNWGEPDFGWPNATSTLWQPGIEAAEEGEMLGRVPSGYDTDEPDDFENLSLPEVELTYPVGGETWHVGRTYEITWNATNTNSGENEDLSISLYYSRNSGHTWGLIASSTENDGSYLWRVPLFLENGAYYVPSPHARIKALATGPENFMLSAESSSEDFCPPIDYSLLTDEEKEILLKLGILPPEYMPGAGNPNTKNEPAENESGNESSEENDPASEAENNDEEEKNQEERADGAQNDQNAGAGGEEDAEDDYNAKNSEEDEGAEKEEGKQEEEEENDENGDEEGQSGPEDENNEDESSEEKNDDASNDGNIPQGSSAQTITIGLKLNINKSENEK